MQTFQFDAGVDSTQRSIRAWQDQIRDPSLTVLLILQLCAIFFAAPLAAKGLPAARIVDDTLLLAALVVVVALSPRLAAIILILPGLAAVLASLVLSVEWLPIPDRVVHRGGDILAFSALTWVVVHAVYARGRIHFIGYRALCSLFELRDDFCCRLWAYLGSEPGRLL